jgi:hypothetical protein
MLLGVVIYVVSTMTGFGVSYGKPIRAAAVADFYVEIGSRGDFILALKEILVSEGFSAEEPYQTEDPRTLHSLQMRQPAGTKVTIVMTPPEGAVKLYIC